MSTLHKEYHTLPEGAKSKYAGKEIKMSISFNKETTSWATNQAIDKGYRVCVTPVERSADGRMEITGAFTGFNYTLLKVERQSAKRLQQAIDTLHRNVDSFLGYFVETTETV